MAGALEIAARAEALRVQFEQAGAQTVAPPILQPAERLIDLYGEDLRARAYVTSDALRGEVMLRPDFTVPVVEMHMAQGAEPARYTYAGPVFRRQEDDPSRPSEYVQVGYEVFDREDPAGADAEVYALIHAAVAGLGLRPVTGDIGILTAAVEGLATTAERKAALMRHIWRPRRFRALLERYATPQSPRALPAVSGVPHVGKRSQAEIDQRLDVLRRDAQEPLITTGDIDLLEALLKVRETVPFALAQLRDLAMDIPSITAAVDRLEARGAALDARGIDLSRLDFEASYGRTALEYYDGFVFGVFAERRPDLPAVASGGRYDALTRRLGRGQDIPAVGAVLRPAVMLTLEEDGRS